MEAQRCYGNEQDHPPSFAAFSGNTPREAAPDSCRASLLKILVSVLAEFSAKLPADFVALIVDDLLHVTTRPSALGITNTGRRPMATDISITNTRSNGPTSSPHILRLPRVCEITGLGRSMIYQLETDGLFPQRIKLTTRTVGWLEGEVHDWIAQRVVSSRPSVSARSSASVAQ